MTHLTDTGISAIKPSAAGQVEYPDSIVKGLRLRVGSGGKKAWIVRARAGAKIVNKTIGAYPGMTLKAAREKADQVLQAIARDGSTEAMDRTFGALCEVWIDKKAKPNNSSWKLQDRRLEMHVLPKWRDRKIASIRKADVHDLIDGIEGDVLPNRVLTVVKTVMRFAVARDWIDASPVEGVHKSKAESPRDRFLDMPECVAVWRGSELAGYPFGPFVKLLLLTGQRRNEVAGMRWDELDLEAGVWSLSGERTKSDRPHVVPLSSSALAILDGLPHFGEYVLSTDGETHIAGFSKGKAWLDGLIDGLGVSVAPWTLHDLRRTAATHMVRLGVIEDVVGRVLNHAPKGVTAQVYALHAYLPEKRSALERWSAELARALADKPADNVVKLKGSK